MHCELLDSARAGLRDLVVLEGRGAAHSDGTDDLATYHDRHAASDWWRPSETEKVDFAAR